MRYYRNDSGEVFAFNDAENSSDWLAEPVIEISEEEALIIVKNVSASENASIVQEV